MLKGLYLCAYKDRHPNYDIDYNDILDIPGINLLGSYELFIKDLDKYDFLIATPPCNYWSKANNRRESSTYALDTKNILPNIINAFIKAGKPFIVENVKNDKLFSKYGMFDFNCYIYKFGRHTYWTNIPFTYIPKFAQIDNIVHVCSAKRQGGYQVNIVLESWLINL